ncbi:putative biotin synthase, partial [Trichinella spiralis]
NRLLRVLAEEGQALKEALDQVMNEEE